MPNIVDEKEKQVKPKTTKETVKKASTVNGTAVAKSKTSDEKTPKTTTAKKSTAKVEKAVSPKAKATTKTNKTVEEKQSKAATKVEKIAAPKKVERISAPKKQEKIAAPKKVERISAPKKQEKIAAPKKQERISAPKKQEKIAAPKKVEKISAPIITATQDIQSVQNGKKILFVASEAAPFVKTGGLGDVAAALPMSLNEKGADCRVILPYYLDIKNEFRQNMQFLGSCYVTLAWRYQYCGVFTYKYRNVTYYFIDNEYYFNRHGLYGHYDDAERFAFFSKAVLESLKIIDFTPDVIHCNDWHTALVPVFLDTFYRNQKECQLSKTVFTIHNIEFQGKYGDGIIADVMGLPLDKSCLVEYDGCTNFMKGAIECSNAITTVSPTYADEVLNSFYGYGLENILSIRKFKLKGIINGIDLTINNPKTDKAIFANYDANSLQDKVKNKLGLQELLGLPTNANVPMIGMVGRLTHQKGFDLLESCLEEVLSTMNIQLVILGTGDWKYESYLKDLQQKYSGKVRTMVNFSSDMASKIYAASDMFLMPSKFEPCGLSQMIAMRYATVPIVRETGGLKDTVVPFNAATGIGTGITFFQYTQADLVHAIERAVGLYNDFKDLWDKVVKNAVEQDFGWDKIADSYAQLYDSL